MQACSDCNRVLQDEDAQRGCPFCGRARAPARTALALLGLMVGCTASPEESGASGTTSGGASGSTSDAMESSSSSGDSSSGATTEDLSTGSTMSSEDTSTGTVMATTGSGGGFIYGSPDTTGGTIECDIFEQDCLEGEKCALWANDGGDVWNAARCVPLSEDPAEDGEACAFEGAPGLGLDTCSAGSACLGESADAQDGICWPYCVTEQQCGEAASCVDQAEMVGVCIPDA